MHDVMDCDTMHQCMNYGHIMIERKVCLYKLWRPHSITMIVTCNIHTYYMSCVLRNTNTLRLKCRGQNAYHVHVLLSMRNCKLMVSSFLYAVVAILLSPVDHNE